MADQKFYDQVARELAAQQLDKGLWVRAFSEAQGNEAKAKAAYIARRVNLLEAQEQAEREAAEQEAERKRRMKAREAIWEARGPAKRAAREARQRAQEALPTWLQDGFRPLHKDPVVLGAIFFLLLALLLAGLFGLDRM